MSIDLGEPVGSIHVRSTKNDSMLAVPIDGSLVVCLFLTYPILYKRMFVSIFINQLQGSKINPWHSFDMGAHWKEFVELNFLRKEVTEGKQLSKPLHCSHPGSIDCLIPVMHQTYTVCFCCLPILVSESHSMILGRDNTVLLVFRVPQQCWQTHGMFHDNYPLVVGSYIGTL